MRTIIGTPIDAPRTITLTNGSTAIAGTGKYTEDTSPNAVGVNINLHKWDGSDPHSITDTTDFSSEYELDLRFSFGRVS